MTRLVIQIPAYNEEKNLPHVLAELPRKLQGVADISVVVVDDGSTDHTAKVALANGADFVLRHRRNSGLSSAFIDGIQFSLALGADIIVNTDADNQYPGSEIERLIAPILAGQADMVVGDRQLNTNEHFSPVKRLMEKLGTSFVCHISSTQVADAASGFRAFSRKAALPLQVYNPYSYTLETLIQAGKSQIAIRDVAVKTNPALRESRLHKGMFNFIWRQAGAIIRSYLLYQPLRTFLSLGGLSLLVGLIPLIRFLYLYFANRGAGHLQSVSIGGTFVVVGIVLIIIGFLGDAVRASRNVAEETLTRLRDSTRFENPADVSEFLGLTVYSQKHLCQD